MARMSNKNPHMSGKVGYCVYRVRDGKVYVTAAPKKYKISKTKAAKAGREKFFFFIKLAKAIHNNFMLELAWENDPSAKGTVANKLLKKYYKLIKDYDLSDFNLAYCKSPFQISLLEAEMNGRIISTSIAPLGEQQSFTVMKNPVVAAQGFIYMYNPAEKEMRKKFLFIPVSSESIATSTSEELTFIFNILNSEAKLLRTFPIGNLCFNLVLKNKAGKPMVYSNTIYTPLNVIS